MRKVVIPIGGQTTTVPGSECPSCLNVLDRATGEQGHTPSPGDFSVCSMCGTILRFEADLTLRPANDDDLEQLDPAMKSYLLGMSDGFKRLTRRLGQGDVAGAFVGIQKQPKPQ